MGDFDYPGVNWLSGDCRGASPEGALFVECLKDKLL